MDIQVEKYKLMEWLIGLNDVDVISRLKLFREGFSKDENVFTDEQIKSIEQGIVEADKGMLTSSEEVREKARKICGL